MIMDRKEAIEVVKKNWPEGRHQIKEALRVLIPELAESEDEKMWKWLTKIVDNLSPADFKEVKKMNVIAWLEKQKEQKPVSWTEQDESNLRVLCLDIMTRPFVAGAKSEDMVSWLKSLRPQPHWKPSEEQMNSLLWVIENANKSVEVNCELNSLYEQLKKLQHG